jgi:hypothetical protein
MIEINTNPVEIILKYDVKVIGMPDIIYNYKWVLQSDYYYDPSLNNTSPVKNGVYMIDTNLGILYLGVDDEWIQPTNGTYDSEKSLTSEVVENVYIKDSNKIYLGVITNTWSQEISFFSGTIFDNNIYKSVYLDESLSIPYDINYAGNKYYIKSLDYISNQIKTIYTKNINYLVSANRTKTLKPDDMADLNNEFYINSRIVDNELLTMNLKVSKVNQNELLYKYKLIDNSNNLSINPNIKYYIQNIVIYLKIMNLFLEQYF